MCSNSAASEIFPAAFSLNGLPCQNESPGDTFPVDRQPDWNKEEESNNSQSVACGWPVKADVQVLRGSMFNMEKTLLVCII